MRVILYSKTDCSQCDAFHFELTDLQSEWGFVYEKRQLGPGDPLLVEWAGTFPVVEIAAAGSGQPLRLSSPTSQGQLRAEIRRAARVMEGG
ncbi:MAG: hypothetical protein KJZ86_18145 [Caldilineaceae bacterium]|nr:hypothetical protein [Caldilineaceae bacterium]